MVGVVDRPDRVREGMDPAQPLLKGDRPHRGGGHHLGARLDVGAVGIGARQVVVDKPHPLERDALAQRVEVGARIGLEAMGEGVHPGAGGDGLGHPDRQLGVADHDRRHEAGVEDDLLHMRRGVRQHPRPADLGAGAGRRRHGDDRGDPARVGARPPVAHILEIPDRDRLPDHERDHLAQIERRAPAKADDAVVPAIAIGRDPGLHVDVGRVGIDAREHRPPEPARLEHIERARRDRERREPAVGDEQRPADARCLAMGGKLGDPAGAELYRGGVGPVGLGRGHFVTFLRW